MCNLQDLEVLGLNESLAEHISKLPGGCLEYGIIQGEVHALNEPLTSAYASHKGAIRTFRREVLKSTRYRGYWLVRNPLCHIRHASIIV